MADLPNNVRFTWQLVSQFVSWEFCRFMSENNENDNSETDVLTFLRNMIVQRTEKSVSEATKHEIIAKFIMEIKALNNFQASGIIPLSESVKRICPELSSAVTKLVYHLETFFQVLESTDERRKELIKLRIEDAISDFSKEANRLLPEPILLKVVDAWNHHHHSVKKSIHNSELLNKVFQYFHFEVITPSEARIIAVSLNEDKVFEKILQNADAEPETEADSEQFTLSQSSQPVYSQEFIKKTNAPRPGVNPLNNELPNLQAHSQVPLQVENSPVQISGDSPVQPLDLGQNENPPEFLAGTPPSPPPSPPEYPFMHSNILSQNQNAVLQKSTSHMQFAQSSANESDVDDADLHNRIEARLQQIHETQVRQNQSDSDTSDCDKNSDFKILTPTYFKNGKNQTIYVSDVESNNSTVLSNMPCSQQTDPNWYEGHSFLPATQYVKPKKTKKPPAKSRKPPTKTIKPSARTIKPFVVTIKPSATSKKHVKPLSSSDSDEDPISLRNSMSSLRSPNQPSTSATRTRAEFAGPLKKRKMMRALYRSPTVCIDDFVSVLRRPNSDSTLSEVSVPYVINAKTAKKTAAPSGMNTAKKLKCKQCNKIYKTSIALRRHIFLKHTEPPEDSDCDD